MSRNRRGLFVPDERGVGGAMEIAQEYHNFFRQERAVRSRSPGQPQGPSAQQLSYHRAVKRATSDTTAHDHLIRLGHMYSRIAAPSSSFAQRRAQQHRLRPSSVAAELCPWLPRADEAGGHLRRPSTAPEQRSSGWEQQPPHCVDSSSTPRQQRDFWQQLKARARPTPQPPLQPVQLPDSRFYPAGPNLLPSVQHRLFKAALMGEILRRQLYRAADIRGLCVAFIHTNPPEHSNLSRQVAAEVLQELEVSYTNELDC